MPQTSLSIEVTILLSLIMPVCTCAVPSRGMTNQHPQGFKQCSRLNARWPYVLHLFDSGDPAVLVCARRRLSTPRHKIITLPITGHPRGVEIQPLRSVTCKLSPGVSCQPPGPFLSLRVFA
jgi:hypothetical protein